MAQSEGGNGLEIEKEGLHTYGVGGEVKNAYFLSLEYNILRHNCPASFLPVRLRDKNGSTDLLYDLTDRKRLTALSGGKGFSLDDCKGFVMDMKRLLEETEELLLSAEHICFEPEHIYRKGEGGLQWMYCPDKAWDISQEVHKFVGWLLSEIDYGDAEAVPFIYHLYWAVKNRSLSVELLEDCLGERAAERKTGQETFAEPFSELSNDVEKQCGEVPYQGWNDFQSGEDIYEKSSVLWEEKAVQREDTGEKKTGKKRLLCLAVQIVCGVLSAGAFVAAAYLLVSGIQRGYSRESTKYLAGMILLCLFFLYVSFRMEEIKKWERGAEKEGEEPGTELLFQEEATVPLNMGREERQPVLKNTISGEVFFLRSFPFYIGKEKSLNQLFLPDNTVSRRHAVIQRGGRGEEYLLRDLQSTNGTWVNGKRLGAEEVMLEPGCRLRFAACEFCFEILDASCSPGY